MILRVEKSNTRGTVRIPASKSHTIRALLIAALAEGQSNIIDPLISEDTASAISVFESLGAQIERQPEKIIVKGVGGFPQVADDVINVGNSGTTLRLGLVAAALSNGYTVFTGDSQIRRRPLGPLIKAINNLGGEAFSVREDDMPPVVVKGRIKGGYTDLDSVTSQFLSALLLNMPLAEKDTEINITGLNEIPYVDITLWWLDKMGIIYQNNKYQNFSIKGGQRYESFSITVPGDFSSATFFMVQAAISKGEIKLQNLDMSDPQGDKLVLSYLENMGAIVEYGEDGIVVKGGELKGIDIDMNSTPDALPAMAVAGCFAKGETRLLNVPQARLKETDRISVMCQELRKMGADITELDEGLIIRESCLKGSRVSGHYDHRVVMALAIAGLNAEGETIIDTAEAVNITFPQFTELMKSCGANMDLLPYI
jgi:3-phosphoshikimate 1-carboxyvinyltransferase